MACERGLGLGFVTLVRWFGLVAVWLLFSFHFCLVLFGLAWCVCKEVKYLLFGYSTSLTYDRINQ